MAATLPSAYWKLPTAEEQWEQRKKEFTGEQKRASWDRTADIVKMYSEEMVKRWNGEIDTLLVYAGLFSAVLTAFNVQSYQLLNPKQPDPLLAALQHISLQLDGLSEYPPPPSLNLTHLVFLKMDDQVSPAPRWAIWLNALWFSSLIFSLSAASIGILVKQWLNEYSMGLSGASRQIARLRQYRLGNLVKWHVVEIVAVLPVLLQIALVLFFGGLLTLLWNLNKTVATIASVLVATLVTFTVGSALLPAFMASCCYLSPPAFVFFEAMRLIRATLCPLRRAISDGLDNVKGGLHDSIARHVDRLSLWLWRVDQSFKFTRRGRELQEVSSSAGNLDTQMVAMAYATTMDADYLEDATICFTDLSPEQVVTCFRAIDAENIRHRRDNWTLIHTMPAPICSDVWLALHMVKRDTRFSNRVEEYLRGSRLSMDSITWNYLIANLSIVTTGDKPFALFETLLVNRSHDHMVLELSLAQRVALLMESALREHLHIADLESLDICCTVLRILLTYLVIHDHADAQPGTETARAIRVLTIHGLVTYFDFRASFPWNDMPYGWIPSYENSLITLLHEHGQTRNLMSTGLVDALVRYAAVYELYPPWLQLQENREWMLELKCKGYPAHEKVTLGGER